MRPIPFVLGGRGRRFRVVAEEPKDSKPTGQSLKGPVPSPAFSDHFHHGHNVRVVQGCVEIEGLQERSQGRTERSRPAKKKHGGTRVRPLLTPLQSSRQRHKHAAWGAASLPGAREEKGPSERAPHSSCFQGAQHLGHQTTCFSSGTFPSTKKCQQTQSLWRRKGLGSHAPHAHHPGGPRAQRRK